MKKLTAFLVVFCMLFGNIMINVLADDYVTIYVAGTRPPQAMAKTAPLIAAGRRCLAIFCLIILM